jgi:hypothetical protein
VESACAAANRAASLTKSQLDAAEKVDVLVHFALRF